LARTGASITALDISPDLLRHARKASDASNVTFIEGNLENLVELKDGTFNALYGVSVLHHLVVPKTLTALRRVLVPGARFAFSEPNLLNPINKFYLFVTNSEARRQRGVSPTEMAFTPDELRRLFLEQGYTVDSLKFRDFLHPATPRWAIPMVKAGEALGEALPLIRRMGGSLWISGRAPL